MGLKLCLLFFGFLVADFLLVSVDTISLTNGWKLKRYGDLHLGHGCGLMRIRLRIDTANFIFTSRTVGKCGNLYALTEKRATP